MSEQQRPQRPAKEPQALSGEYHKARKQLMLWAGILFIWELVGIDLEKARQAGGTSGAIIASIKSPQAVPWVLLILVGYFLFKLWIEWNQCEDRRRATFYSRVDFGSAWVVTFLAYALYAYQALKGIQLADALQGSLILRSFLFGIMLGIPVPFVVIAGMLHYKGVRRVTPRKLISSVAEATVILFIVGTGLRSGLFGFRYIMIALFIGALIGSLTLFIFRKLKLRKLKLAVQQLKSE